MPAAEAARPDGIEAVSIATPKHLHAPAIHAFLDAVLAARSGRAASTDALFPTIEDGVESLAFIDAAVRSSSAGAVWTAMPA